MPQKQKIYIVVGQEFGAFRENIRMFKFQFSSFPQDPYLKRISMQGMDLIKVIKAANTIRAEI